MRCLILAAMILSTPTATSSHGLSPYLTRCSISWRSLWTMPNTVSILLTYYSSSTPEPQNSLNTSAACACLSALRTHNVMACLLLIVCRGSCNELVHVGNIYGAVPNNAARNASIVLMIIHQAVAYALYVTPGKQKPRAHPLFLIYVRNVC